MSIHRVVVVLLDGVRALDLGIPLQIFDGDDLPQYTVSTASSGGAPVRMLENTHVTPSAGLESLETADTVIVPGYDLLSGEVPGDIVEALRAAHERGTRMVSICTGAFALAEAGILDGLTATTHWLHCGTLAARHPTVTVDPGVLFIDHGRVLTSAGVAAGIDLCLHIVRHDVGASLANHIARRIVAAPRREGHQAQFIERAVVPPGTDSLAGTREWMLQALDEPLTVAHMAAVAKTSPRSFSRNFTAQTGQTPLRWLHAQRVELAKELLETTEMGIDAIAARSGLGSPANFRTHFKRATSLSPQRYRAAFAERTTTEPGG